MRRASVSAVSPDSRATVRAEGSHSSSLARRLLSEHPGLVAAFVFTSLGRTALTALSFLLIREFLGGALGETGSRAARAYGPDAALWAMGILLLLSHFGSTALTYASKVNQQKLVKVIEVNTMERLIVQLLGLSVAFFDRHLHGDLVQTVRQDVVQLRVLTIAAAKLVLESLQVVGVVAAAVILSPALALWAFLLVPLALGPIALIARRTRARSFGVRHADILLFDVLLQRLGSVRITKVYSGERAEAARMIGRARRYFDELIAMERVRSLSWVVLDSIAGLGLVIVVLVGGYQVLRGTLDWPALLAFLLAARSVQGPISNVNTSLMEIQSNRASVARIDALLAETPEIRDLPGARPLPGRPTRVALEGVSYSINGVPVLDGVSFSLAAGETLGIVGASGAGKSTIFDLVARFRDPDAGAVTFDGHDLRTVPLADVHGSIALVTQDPVVFTTSIRENIRCGRPGASDAEVESAARVAEIHGDVSRMPDGYDTVVGSGGRALSRGEAQRINIARAVLKDAPVLLLDEATASLDSHTEARVQRAIDRLVTGRLTICIAHRFSTLRNADRVLVLEGGRSVGLGTHAELLERCPTYQRLWWAEADSGAELEHR